MTYYHYNSDEAQYGVHDLSVCQLHCQHYKDGLCIGIECDNHIQPEDEEEEEA